MGQGGGGGDNKTFHGRGRDVFLKDIVWFNFILNFIYMICEGPGGKWR